MVTRKQCLVCFSEKPSTIHHSDIEKSIIEGELHFFFSVDMREFLSNPENPQNNISKAEFEKLQGSKEFANELRKMEVSLEEDVKAKELFINGFNNGVFGGILIKWLDFPTFIINDADGKWFIRCSWLGLFEVHLKKIISKEDKYDFVKVIEEVLRYRTRYDESNKDDDNIDENNIWYKVFDKINTFCSKVTKFNYDNIKFRKIPLSNHISFTQRQRYGIVVAKEIICNKCNKRLPAEILCKNTLLTSLLYSSLVSDFDSENKSVEQIEQIKIPDLTIDEVKNLSTWSNEICAFGSERGFIYYNPNVKVQEHQDSYIYDDYWKYIMRGVQHTVTVRATMLSLQTQIKKLTDKLPGLLAKIDLQNEYENREIKSTTDMTISNPNNNSEDDLALSLSNILQIMPKISTVCIPTIAFKANFAVDKFKYLNEECFDFPAVLLALRRDIRDVSAFLEFSKSYQLQITIESRREQERERQRLEDERNKNEKERNRIANERLEQRKYLKNQDSNKKENKIVKERILVFS